MQTPSRSTLPLFIYFPRNVVLGVQLIVLCRPMLTVIFMNRPTRIADQHKHTRGWYPHTVGLPYSFFHRPIFLSFSDLAFTTVAGRNWGPFAYFLQSVNAACRCEYRASAGWVYHAVEPGLPLAYPVKQHYGFRKNFNAPIVYLLKPTVSADCGRFWPGGVVPAVSTKSLHVQLHLSTEVRGAISWNIAGVRSGECDDAECRELDCTARASVGEMKERMLLSWCLHAYFTQHRHAGAAPRLCVCRARTLLQPHACSLWCAVLLRLMRFGALWGVYTIQHSSS